jgi:hypothetical protein
MDYLFSYFLPLEGGRIKVGVERKNIKNNVLS